ncbi:MAG: FG-GAP repeat protein [Candidatus Electrothrix sp. YB6]
MKTQLRFFFIIAVLIAAISPARAAIDPDTVQKLVAEDGAASDFFGYSVSVSGDTAVISAHGDDDKGSFSGSAYVFVRSGDTWTQQDKLVAEDGAASDIFGYSVSVSGDTAVIGAYYDDDKGSSSGSAYVFVRSGDTWTQQDKLVAEDGAASDFFGYSVSVSGDTAVIGAYYDDDKGSSSGSAYVFVRSGDTWTQQNKFVAEDGAADDNFGCSVSVSGDTAVIGAPYDDDKGSSSGSAYVFVRSGDTWTQQNKLVAEDGAAFNIFGRSVSVSGDTAVISAPYDDDNGSRSGSAYVFVRTGDTWTQQNKLVAEDGAADDNFGCSVSVSGDTAVIGAYGEGREDEYPGSAYIFVRSGDTWTWQDKLIAEDGAAGDLFGGSVSVSGDTVVIGAKENDDKASRSGSAYVFGTRKKIVLVPILLLLLLK